MDDLRNALKAMVEAAESAAQDCNTSMMDEYINKARDVINKYDGWNKMDTAPNDGSQIDLWHKDGFRETGRWTYRRLRHSGREETGWTTRDGTTHAESDFVAWRSLPDPPNFWKRK